MRSPLLEEVTEREFQTTILELATLHGWKNYHTYYSKRSPAGFPDLVLVRPPELVFVEVKKEMGRVTFEQQTWLDLLSACGGVEAYLWRPSDWPTIETRLTRVRFEVFAPVAPAALASLPEPLGPTSEAVS